MLAVGDAAVAPHRREGLQEQVQSCGSRQVWVHVTCSSGAARCPARLSRWQIGSCELGGLLQSTARVQRGLTSRGLGSCTEPWYWPASPASENKQQSAAGGCEDVRCVARGCIHRRSIHLRRALQEQPVYGGHDAKDARIARSSRSMSFPPRRHICKFSRLPRQA